MCSRNLSAKMEQMSIKGPVKKSILSKINPNIFSTRIGKMKAEIVREQE